MRLPASQEFSAQNMVESDQAYLLSRDKLQSNFWGLSIFTLLLGLALLSILSLGQKDH